MNTTGKSLTALLLLASILGIGWWAVQKRPPPSVFDTAPSPAMSGVVGEAPGRDALLMPNLGPDPLLVAEIDASLQWVAQMLAATGNIPSAISMLNVLEHRITRLDPQGKAAALKKAIVADRQSLQAASAEDPVSLAAKLDQLLLQVDNLPLVSSAPPASKSGQELARPARQSGQEATPVAPSPGPSGSLWAAFWSDMKTRLLDVVQIRRVENPDAFFMTPEQGALVAERLRLRLLSARTALLTRQDALFTQDMAVVEKLLNQVFDAAAPEVVTAKAALLSVREAGLAFKAPTLTQSLSEIRRLRPTPQTTPQ